MERSRGCVFYKLLSVECLRHLFYEDTIMNDLPSELFTYKAHRKALTLCLMYSLHKAQF